MNCETCKWWMRHGGNNSGRCDNPKLNDERLTCDDTLWGEGDFGDTAIIHTGAKFGCILWESAPDKSEEGS